MKKNLFKRGMAGLLSLVMCLTALVGIGTTTAYAAGERAEVYLVSFPRSGDANIDYSGTWGHPNLRYMNGWHSGESKYTTIRAMHSYDGNICYCIEPGVRQDTGDTYTSKDETFWDNLPSDINSTISPYDMKLFIGRIMQYGYTGPISTSWRSQNPADAATLAEAMATQVLIWETVVGERDEDFDYVSPGSYDAVKGVISTAHPLYDLFCDYYDSIEARTAKERDAKAARNLQSALDNTVGADAEIHGVLVLVCTAERAQLDCGVYVKDVQRLAWQIDGKFLRTAEVGALVGNSFISTFLPVELERIAEAVDELRILPQPDDADIRCLEGNFTGAQNDVACTLNQMHIGTRQRTPQLDGRDGEVVAVHGFCQILKTRAAAVKLPDGNRRHKGDARAGLDKEPQLVGNE